MDEIITTTFKVAFEIGGDVEFRYLNIEKKFETNLLYLQSKLNQEFPCLQASPPNYKINWQDYEGDNVAINSDEALAFALKSMPDIKKLRVIYVDPNNAGDQIVKEIHGFITSTRKRGSNSRTQHVGIMCDSCNGEIFGYRYKCLICPDFDLCQKCESQNKHSVHYMLRIPKPVRSLPCDLKGSKLGEWLNNHIKKGNKDEGQDFSYGKKHCKGKTSDRDRRCRFTLPANLFQNQAHPNLYQKLGEYFNEFTNLAGELKTANEEEAREAWAKAKATQKQATTSNELKKESASTSQQNVTASKSDPPQADFASQSEPIEVNVSVPQKKPIEMDATTSQNPSDYQNQAKLLNATIASIIDNIMDANLQAKLPIPVDATPVAKDVAAEIVKNKAPIVENKAPIVENKPSIFKVSKKKVSVVDCSDSSSDESMTLKSENEWTMVNSDESNESAQLDAVLKEKKEDMDAIIDAFRKKMEVCKGEVKVTTLNPEESNEEPPMNVMLNENKEDLNTFLNAFRKNIEVCTEEVKLTKDDLQNKETRFVLLDPPPIDSAMPTIDSAMPPIDSAMPPIESATPPMDSAIPPIRITVTPIRNTMQPNNTMPIHFINSMEMFKECPTETGTAPPGALNHESRNFTYIPNFTAAGNVPPSEMPQPIFGFCSPQIPNYVSPQFPPPIPSHVHNSVFMASNQTHPMSTPFNNSVYSSGNNMFHPVGVGYPPGYMPVIPRGNYAPNRVPPMGEAMRPPNVTVTNSHANTILTGVRNPKQSSRDLSRKATLPLSTLTSVANPQTPTVASVNTSTSFYQNYLTSDDRLVRNEVNIPENPTRLINNQSNTNTAGDTAEVRHAPNARIADVLRKMIDMGFSNENGVLLNILENLDGDVNATIDFLSTQK